MMVEITPADLKKLKKIHIVIEETGEENGYAFQISLQADPESKKAMDEMDTTGKLSVGEYHALMLFDICKEAVKDIIVSNMKPGQRLN